MINLIKQWRFGAIAGDFFKGDWHQCL